MCAVSFDGAKQHKCVQWMGKVWSFCVEVLAIYSTFILLPPFTFVAVSKIAVYTQNGAVGFKGNATRNAAYLKKSRRVT